MAKETITVTVKDLTAATVKTFNAVKGKILSIGADLAVVRQRVDEIAPSVLALMTKVKQEITEKYGEMAGARWVVADFARLIDPSVPMHARRSDNNPEPGYTEHKTYRALVYMQQATARKRSAGTGPGQGRRNYAKAQVERLIASILTIAKGDEARAFVLKTFSEEFGLQPARLKRLTTDMENVKPVLDLSAIIKPVDLTKATPVHMAGASGSAEVANMDDGQKAVNAVRAAERGRQRKAA